MDIAGKIVVVTGGADGIGAALCRRFHADGAKAVVPFADQAQQIISSRVNGLGVSGSEVVIDGETATRGGARRCGQTQGSW